jgi:hypothetical protein
MRNCFAHFREHNNGLQAFGINTTVRQHKLHSHTARSSPPHCQEQALARASNDWCYTGSGMQRKIGPLEMPAAPGAKTQAYSARFMPCSNPSHKEAWLTEIPKKDAAVMAGGPAASVAAPQSRGQQSFDILE